LPPISSSSSWKESRTNAVWALPSQRRSHADSPCAISRITGIQGEAADRTSMSSVIDTVFNLSPSPLPSLGETKLVFMAEHHRPGSAGGGTSLAVKHQCPRPTTCQTPRLPLKFPLVALAHEIEHLKSSYPRRIGSCSQQRRLPPRHRTRGSGFCEPISTAAVPRGRSALVQRLPRECQGGPHTLASCSRSVTPGIWR
jgi:hypothetical protein